MKNVSGIAAASDPSVSRPGETLRRGRDAVLRVAAAGDERADLLADVENRIQPRKVNGDDRAGNLETRNV